MRNHTVHSLVPKMLIPKVTASHSGELRKQTPVPGVLEILPKLKPLTDFNQSSSNIIEGLIKIKISESQEYDADIAGLIPLREEPGRVGHLSLKAGVCFI